MKKNVLLIMAHPDKESLCNSLADAYQKGAKSKCNFRRINLGELKFNPVLKYGYRKKMKLEPDLIKAQKDIKWANHIVWVFPSWWASFPSLLKGFVDRIFLPGYAFKYTGSMSWDKLLKGRSSRLIVTMGAPVWYYKWILGSPGIKVFDKSTLRFCGISPVKKTLIGGVTKNFKHAKKWIKKVNELGKNLS